MVGKRVQDARRDDDVFAPAATPREADCVVALAQVRVAGSAARTAHAADVSLAHDALAGCDRRHALADRVDHAAPLVTRDDRKAHPALVERSRQDVEVRPADAGDDAPDAGLARTGLGRLQVAQGDVVRPLDDDRSHALRERIAVRMSPVILGQAMAAVQFVVENSPAPVSVFVADTHGEVVAAATMDGAAPDTRLNAQRKAYTAARSDATSTARLAEKALADAAERESFDPFFTFFKGGVAAFDGDRRVGAVGVSGLPGEDDDALARQAIAAAGLSVRDF